MIVMNNHNNVEKRQNEKPAHSNPLFCTHWGIMLQISKFLRDYLLIRGIMFIFAMWSMYVWLIKIMKTSFSHMRCICDNALHHFSGNEEEALCFSCQLET